MKSVAVIGCGEIGGPVAARMAKVYPLIACDLDLERLNALAERGIKVTAQIKDCTSVDTIFVCVATEQQLTAVIDALPHPPQTLVILSTVSPEVVRDIARRLAGAVVVDAPVSGGSDGAEAGTLTVMAGGAAADVQALRPLFNCFASHVVHCGPLGAGQLTKIINNVLCHTNAVLMAEACRLGVTQGLSIDAMAEVLEVSTGRNFLTARPKCVASFYLGFAERRDRFDGLMQIFRKDLGLAANLATASCGGFPAIEGIQEIMNALGDDTRAQWRGVGATSD